MGSRGSCCEWIEGRKILNLNANEDGYERNLFVLMIDE